MVDLVYSKVSARPARWVLAVPDDAPYKGPRTWPARRSPPNWSTSPGTIFPSGASTLRLEFSWGATEAKVVAGLADAIVEVTETGTIKAHGLRILHELMLTNTQLIANQTAWEDAFKRGKIEHIALLLKGALRGEKLSGLKMNVPKE